MTGKSSSTSAPGDVFATTHWTVVLAAGRPGSRQQIDGKPAGGLNNFARRLFFECSGKRSATPLWKLLGYFLASRRPKAPSPLRSAGAVQSGWVIRVHHCLSVVKMILL